MCGLCCSEHCVTYGMEHRLVTSLSCSLRYSNWYITCLFNSLTHLLVQLTSSWYHSVNEFWSLMTLAVPIVWFWDFKYVGWVEWVRWRSRGMSSLYISLHPTWNSFFVCWNHMAWLCTSLLHSVGTAAFLFVCSRHTQVALQCAHLQVVCLCDLVCILYGLWYTLLTLVILHFTKSVIQAFWSILHSISCIS